MNQWPVNAGRLWNSKIHSVVERFQLVAPASCALVRGQVAWQCFRFLLAATHCFSVLTVLVSYRQILEDLSETWAEVMLMV